MNLRLFHFGLIHTVDLKILLRARKLERSRCARLEHLSWILSKPAAVHAVQHGSVEKRREGFAPRPSRIRPHRRASSRESDSSLDSSSRAVHEDATCEVCTTPVRCCAQFATAARTVRRPRGPCGAATQLRAATQSTTTILTDGNVRVPLMHSFFSRFCRQLREGFVPRPSLHSTSPPRKQSRLDSSTSAHLGSGRLSKTKKDTVNILVKQSTAKFTRNYNRAGSKWHTGTKFQLFVFNSAKNNRTARILTGERDGNFRVHLMHILI